MSDKTRKKKGGADVGKQRRRMREAVDDRERPRVAGSPRDGGDTVPFKRGSASDRTQDPATKHVRN